jgi:AGCS family alanine or glycine:cation symporter
MRRFLAATFMVSLFTASVPALADVPSEPPPAEKAEDAEKKAAPEEPADKPAPAGEGEKKGEKAQGPLDKFFGKLDAFFGEYLVLPLFKGLFFDLIFWDDTVEGADAVGASMNGLTVGAFDAEKGYRLDSHAEAKLADAQVIIPEARDHDLGRGITAKISGGPGTFNIDVPSAPMPSGEVNLTPIADWKGILVNPGRPAADNEYFEVASDLAPFPVIVVVKTTEQAEGDPVIERSLLAMRVEHAIDVKVAVGETVKLKEGEGGKVLAIDGEKLTLETKAPQWVPKSAAAEVKNPKNLNLPFIVVWLVLGAVFFTFKMGFINIRAFKHAIEVTAGKYDDPEEDGEITHFQALASALSATIGLGNIAGVALAVSAGGPGALFWMVVAAFFGMSSKFVECTLGQIYRTVDERGRILGGPMRYLSAGLKEKGLGTLGAVSSLVFAIMCIGGSFGGGNMFQANQAYAAISNAAESFGVNMHSTTASFVFGVVLAILVGLVIIGGIQRIGKAASFIVPFMCGMYILAALAVLVMNIGEVPAAFGTIIGEAFSLKAGFGGLIGVLITGFRRAAFSNEAGVGSAAIAHSAAATGEPVREGIVALLGPFIDTIVICTMTGLVVVITGAYQAGAGDGVLMTSYAFETVFPWFPVVLSIAVFFFAFSTMISWSYYGDRCFTMLFGERFSIVYKIMFLFFVVFGCVFKLGNVLDFSDLMVLGMAFPNILGVVLLSGVVKERLDDYWGRYTSGEMRPPEK